MHVLCHTTFRVVTRWHGSCHCGPAYIVQVACQPAQAPLWLLVSCQVQVTCRMCAINLMRALSVPTSPSLQHPCHHPRLSNENWHSSCGIRMCAQVQNLLACVPRPDSPVKPGPRRCSAIHAKPFPRGAPRASGLPRITRPDFVGELHKTTTDRCGAHISPLDRICDGPHNKRSPACDQVNCERSRRR